MMNKLLKFLMVAGVAGIALFYAGTYARAATVCGKGSWTEIAAQFEDKGITALQLNADQIASMVAKVGSPPSVEGNFDAYLIVDPPVAAVFIVQDGCLQDRLGPTREDAMNNILGIVKAEAPKGERID